MQFSVTSFDISDTLVGGLVCQGASGKPRCWHRCMQIVRKHTSQNLWVWPRLPLTPQTHTHRHTQLQRLGSVFWRDSRTDNLLQVGTALVTWCLGGRKGLRRMRTQRFAKTEQEQQTELVSAMITKTWPKREAFLSTVVVSHWENTTWTFVVWLNQTPTLSVFPFYFKMWTRWWQSTKKIQKLSLMFLVRLCMFC